MEPPKPLLVMSGESGDPRRLWPGAIPACAGVTSSANAQSKPTGPNLDSVDEIARRWAAAKRGSIAIKEKPTGKQHLLTKSETRATMAMLAEFAGLSDGGASDGVGRWFAIPTATQDASWKGQELFYFFACNHLKRLDSEKLMKTNERNFAFICFHSICRDFALRLQGAVECAGSRPAITALGRGLLRLGQPGRGRDINAGEFRRLCLQLRERL